MAFFEKALSAEEHQQVYDTTIGQLYLHLLITKLAYPFCSAFSQSIQIDLFLTITAFSMALQMTEDRSGDPHDPSLASVAQDISIDVSSKTSSVSIDNSSHTSEVLVCPLPIRAPRLDLDAKYWVDGSDTWHDASISEAHFEVEGSPTKTADGFYTVNSSNRFVRTVVTAPDPLTTNIEDYVRDPFIPYDTTLLLSLSLGLIQR